MRRTRMQITRMVLMTLSVSVGSATMVKASSMSSQIGYTTTGAIGTNGASGAAIVAFRGIDDTFVPEQGLFKLGDFVVTPPLNGGITTYDRTPFSIYFRGPESLEREVIDTGPAGTPYSQWSITHYAAGFTLEGLLDGRVDGTDQSHLVATIHAIWPTPLVPYRPDQTVVVNGLPFPLEDLSYPRSLTIELDRSGGGTVALTAEVVPEPASWAIFTVAALGLAAYQRVRNATRRSSAPKWPRSSRSR